MKPTTNIRNLAIGLTLAALLPTGLSAATVFTIGFNTDGDFEGFTNTTNIDGPGAGPTFAVVSGGFLTGVPAGGDPRIENNTTTFSKLPSETWSTLVFRVRESIDGGPTFIETFDATGVSIVFNGGSVGGSISGVASGDNFITVTKDISSFTADDITSLRFDPVGAADANNNTFDVDFVQINAVPEPSAALLGVLGSLCLLRRRR